jgi:mannose-6-phosphate isomerase
MDLLTFDPIIKTTRWGGTKLGTVLHKPIGSGDRYAESWEIADFSNDRSYVNSGSFKKSSLNQLLSEHKKEILGKHSYFEHFPILVKFLDVADRLSLQVHPDDEYTQTHQIKTSGKTEAWIILESNPESRVYAGLKKNVSPQDFSDSIRAGNIDSCVHSFPVKPGDAILVPAGTVHALGEGILLAEFQQMSHLTFRIHDWGRLDLNGKPRELHWEQALASIHFNQQMISPAKPVMIDNEKGLQELIRCEHFVIRKYTTSQNIEFTGTDNYFRIFTIVTGSAEFSQGNRKVLYKTGQTILAPAITTEFSIKPVGEAQILEAFLP